MKPLCLRVIHSVLRSAGILASVSSVSVVPSSKIGLQVGDEDLVLQDAQPDAVELADFGADADDVAVDEEADVLHAEQHLAVVRLTRRNGGSFRRRLARVHPARPAPLLHLDERRSGLAPLERLAHGGNGYVARLRRRNGAHERQRNPCQHQPDRHRLLP